MPTRKMRVELFDNNGVKYTLAVEGSITRDKALQLLDMMELIGVMPNETQASNNSNNVFPTELSLFEKVQKIIQKNFPIVWFSSKEVLLIYEQELKEPVKLSTVSTYLARMTTQGLLIRTGTGNNVKYKTVSNIQQQSIQQPIKPQIKNSY
ncbi:MAG: hypothetical protein FWH37_06610 [Candidatus Bathyarchaeota archaeon]|nr:hypothetical protein [Candidatus Termiticorpusculum sp.]